jgi:hypothetical protein
MIAKSLLILFIICTQSNYLACSSQNYQNQSSNLETLLNQVDKPNNWQQTPSIIPAPSPLPEKAIQANTNSENPFSMRGLLKTFFGNSSPNSGNSTNNSQAEGNAQSNLQTALNEASQAESAANEAQYNRDRWVKQNSASSAQNHANAARAAADRATSAAYGTSSLANDYASQARAAASRAQAAADRARYNASISN